ncbi:beta/alpha barrel domain-containing protein [Reichenbachiella versicolor]|uniref:hypothetical protein n=1 Tax=Reichenbachiella versicolor TaxID=1821036 RepID=UPI000D6E33DF|nr:hypothetical protein [Reichenbachiella versicolor]
MNLKTFVKVGNISNLSDARYCAGFGVNLLGFNIDNSQSDAISLEKANEIIGWVAVEDIILEAGELSSKQISEIKEQSGINYFQVDNLSVANELSALGYSIVLRIMIHSEEQITRLNSTLFGLSENVKFLLIESHDELFTEILESKITELEIDVPILKGFNLDEKKLDSVIDSNSAFSGIALNGSEEHKPGFKDYDELADILEYLEEEN